MINPTENRLKAIIGTVCFISVYFLCFVFMGLTYQVPPPAEEGITINLVIKILEAILEQEQMIEEKKISSQELFNNNPFVEDVITQSIEETPATKPKEQLEKHNEVKKIEEKKPELVVNKKALYSGKSKIIVIVKE